MRKHRPDFTILLLTVGLMVAGLIIVYAIGPRAAQSEGLPTDYYFAGHLKGIVASIAFLLLGAFVPYEKVGRFSKSATIFALVLCFLTAILGRAGVESLIICDEGACRALNVPIFGSFQPAELLKVAVLFYGAWLVSDRRKKGQLAKSEFWIPMATIIIAVAVAVAFLEKDLGSTAVIYMMLGVMMFVGEMPWKQLGVFAVVIAVCVAILIQVAPHRLDRLASFSGQGDDFHIMNSLIGFGTGGAFGVGLGNSVQTTGYLPEAPSDSIFSVVGEAWGFLGAAAILIVYAILMYRIIDVSRKTEDEEQSFFVLGVFAWIFSHVIINVGGMLALMPMKGITLPFLSHGGSSMMLVSYAVGMTLQISRWTRREAIDENSSSRRGQRGARNAGSRRRT
ncbi:MAG: FtsW/RodA/SpoVE family cell cycle protein [Candidatus Saccharibacteria bacterium]|nr:FtsW/RodA/SpoVE family cell cycle protein [Candidatus Saccharibacteria bacterium]